MTDVQLLDDCGNLQTYPVQRSSVYLVMDDELFMSATRKFTLYIFHASFYNNADQ